MNIVRALGAGVTMGSLEDKFTSVKFFSDMSFLPETQSQTSSFGHHSPPKWFRMSFYQ